MFRTLVMGRSSFPLIRWNRNFQLSPDHFLQRFAPRIFNRTRLCPHEKDISRPFVVFCGWTDPPHEENFPLSYTVSVSTSQRRRFSLNNDMVRRGVFYSNLLISTGFLGSSCYIYFRQISSLFALMDPTFHVTFHSFFLLWFLSKMVEI